MSNYKKQYDGIIMGWCDAVDIMRKAESLEKALDELTNKIRARRIIPIPAQMSKSEEEEMMEAYAKRAMNIALATILEVFEQEFGYGKKRLKDLAAKYMTHFLRTLWRDPYGGRYIDTASLLEYYRTTYDVKLDVDVISEIAEGIAAKDEKESPRVQFSVVEKHLKNSHPEALEHLRKVLGI